MEEHRHTLAVKMDEVYIVRWSLRITNTSPQATTPFFPLPTPLGNGEENEEGDDGQGTLFHLPPVRARFWSSLASLSTLHAAHGFIHSLSFTFAH